MLRNPAYARILAGVLQRFDGQRYRLHSWIVMPNHVHLLLSLSSGQALQKALQGWKGVSSREINRCSGRRGSLWQKDYFDTIVRDTRHFWRCARYIRRNPAKARLSSIEFLYESADVKAVLDGEATFLSPDL